MDLQAKTDQPKEKHLGSDDPKPDYKKVRKGAGKEQKPPAGADRATQQGKTDATCSQPTRKKDRTNLKNRISSNDLAKYMHQRLSTALTEDTRTKSSPKGDKGQ